MKDQGPYSQRRLLYFPLPHKARNMLKPPFRQNRQGRWIRFSLTGLFLILIGLGPIVGCGGPAEPAKRGPTSLGRAKPEGLLLVTRELDLGTLPVGGSIEAMLAVKNPNQTEAVRVERYEISGEGLLIDPKRMELGPGGSGPINLIVQSEATREPGPRSWDVTGWDEQQRVAFRVTIHLKVSQVPPSLDP